MSDESDPIEVLQTPVELQYTYSAGRSSSRFLRAIAEGRLVLGIGYGWNHEEMENHGIDVKRRRARVRRRRHAPPRRCR